jgi:hypothetical protein
VTLLTPPGFLQAGTYSALLDRIYNVTTDSVRNFALLHGSRQGFYANRFPVYSNPSGMNTAVTACAGIIANNFTTDGGDYKFSNPTSFTVTHAASSPTQNRNDIVGIQVKDNFYDSSGLNQVAPVILQGANSAGTPSDPAIPNGFIPIVRAVINANVTSPTYQDMRVYTTNDGGLLPVASATERAAIGTPPGGFTIWRIDRGWTERWNAAAAAWQVQNLAVCTSIADRDAAITSPYNGQLAYTSDTGKVWQRHSGAWRSWPLQVIAHYRQTVTQSLTNFTATDILFDVEDIDDLNAHSTVSNTGRFTAPFDGTYVFSGGIPFAANATGTRVGNWAKNGTALAASDVNALTVGAGAATRINARRYPVVMVAGDFVTLQGLQDSGGSLSTVASGAVAASMVVEYGGR